MLSNGQAMYLLKPAESEKRILLPGKVVESSADSFAIVLESPMVFEVGTETLAFCEIRGKFFQQGATLSEIRTEPAALVFKRATEPVNAEQRQTYRVSVALSDIFASVGGQKKCQISDFSPEGLGLVGSPGFSLGSTQKVGFACEGHTFSADARVQTIKVLPSGKVRYGLLVPKADRNSRNTLQKLSIAFQRTQLRRLAGAA